MPVNMNELFRDRAIQIRIGDDRGVGVVLTNALIDEMGAEDLRALIGQPPVAGGIITAMPRRDEQGALVTNAAGQPVRKGGFIHLGGGNDLSIMIPYADPEQGLYELRVDDHRTVAKNIAGLVVNARAEEQRLAAAHEEAMVAYERATARGELIDAPVAGTPRFEVRAFARFADLIEASAAYIVNQTQNPFISVHERAEEMLASFAQANATRQTLTREELAKVAEKQSLRAEIGRLSPAHQLADRQTAGTFNGPRENVEAAVKAFAEGPMNLYFAAGGRTGGGELMKLMAPVMATFTTEKPEHIRAAPMSAANLRRFQQDFERFASPEITDTVAQRLSGVFGELMPGYQVNANTASSANVRFYNHNGVDLLLVADLRSTTLYIVESAARTTDFDLEHFTRAPVEADIPSDAELAELRVVLQGLVYNNEGEIAFDNDLVMFGQPQPAIEDAEEVAEPLQIGMN